MFDQVANAIGQSWLIGIAAIAEMVGLACLVVIIARSERERQRDEAIYKRQCAEKQMDERIEFAINPPMTQAQINRENMLRW